MDAATSQPGTVDKDSLVVLKVEVDDDYKISYDDLNIADISQTIKECDTVGVKKEIGDVIKKEQDDENEQFDGDQGRKRKSNNDDLLDRFKCEDESEEYASNDGKRRRKGANNVYAKLNSDVEASEEDSSNEGDHSNDDEDYVESEDAIDDDDESNIDSEELDSDESNKVKDECEVGKSENHQGSNACAKCSGTVSERPHDRNDVSTETGQRQLVDSRTLTDARTLASGRYACPSADASERAGPCNCSRRDRSAGRRTDLGTNVKDKRNEKSFKCDKCEYHILVEHGEEESQGCRQCGLYTGCRDCLEKHVQEHRREKTFKCDQCDYSAGYKLHIRRHAETKHTFLFKCPLCHFSSGCKIVLQDHILLAHKKGGTFESGECTFTAGYKDRLHVHVRETYNQKLYDCKHCNKRITAKHSVRSFKCHQCNFLTPCTDVLKEHIQAVHKGGRTFECSKCDFSAGYKGLLNQHVRRTHNVKLHERKLADYSTGYGPNLRGRAQVQRDNEESFECSLCNFSSVSKDSLRRHVKVVHEKQTFKCSRCDYVARRKDHLKNHVKVKHDKIV